MSLPQRQTVEIPLSNSSRSVINLGPIGISITIDGRTIRVEGPPSAIAEIRTQIPQPPRPTALPQRDQEMSERGQQRILRDLARRVEAKRAQENDKSKGQENENIRIEREIKKRNLVEFAQLAELSERQLQNAGRQEQSAGRNARTGLTGDRRS